MATEFRSDAEVVNGTAGTSVTVAKPSGIVDTGDNGGRDHLIAFISCTGTTTITPPAGWELVTSAVDAGSGVTMWCYRKLPSSEGANWTWTLGASRRNWGWVGAYTGVDPDDPVSTAVTDLTLTTSTTLTQGAAYLYGGMGISGASAVRTASGAATTWTNAGSDERADMSTNGGAGTDIAGCVHDGDDDGFGDFQFVTTAVASQNQTAGVMIAFGLNPYFVPYDGSIGGAGLIVEAAFGADPDGDPDDWTWTNITAHVHQPAKVVLRHGRSNRASLADPSELRLTLLNLNGEFTHPAGAYTEQFVRNLPMRVRLNGFGVNVGGDGYQRGTMFLASARPRWDQSTNFSVVDVVASGMLRRLQQRDEPLHSAAYTAIHRTPSVSGFVAPVAHWPFEDGSTATDTAASAVSGVPPANVADVNFAANSDIVGSAPLATLNDTTSIAGDIPAYSNNTEFAMLCAAVIPTEPAAETIILIAHTDGTAAEWQITIAPGSPSTLHIRAYDASNVSILDDSVALDEADVYGTPILLSLIARQDGANVDYEVTHYSGGGGVAKTGTLNSRTHGTVNRIRIVGSAGLDGATMGHVAVYGSPLPTVVPFTAVANAALLGNTGEWPWERFGRLCDELNIAYSNQSDLDTLEDLFMGPQTVAPFMTLIREPESVANVVITDSGGPTTNEGLLWFPALSNMTNLEPSLTLDMSQGHVQGIDPALDDQDIVNDSEASRRDGSSARVTDDASIALEGRYDEQRTLNVEDDSMLLHLAGWRVNLGTAPGMRFPHVSWNMRRPSTATLAQEWMDTRLFHRVDILNPPSQYPPDDIRAFLEGYVETLSSDEWTVDAYLSPYRPYEVFEVADETADDGEFVGRLAGDDACAVRTAVDDNDTAIVFDPNHYRWTTTADDFDPDLQVRLGGEVVEASTIATTAATFVAAGTVDHDVNAAVNPSIPAGSQANDLMVMFAAVRNSGTGVPDTPTGWTRLTVFGSADNCQVFAKLHSGSESSPTVTFSGSVAGADTSAQIASFRNMPITLDDLADVVLDARTLLNSSAQDITVPHLYPGVHPGRVVLAFGWKQDDWTSVAPPSGFTEIGEPDTTTGDDHGITWAYRIDTTPAIAPRTSFVVTGGGSAISRSAVCALAGGFQTMTVTRSVNGVQKSHAVGTRIEVERALVLGL